MFPGANLMGLAFSLTQPCMVFGLLNGGSSARQKCRPVYYHLQRSRRGLLRNNDEESIAVCRDNPSVPSWIDFTNAEQLLRNARLKFAVI